MLFAGICLVLVARGCDGLGVRNIGRLRARATSAPQRFQRETTRLIDAEDGDEAKRKIREDRDKQRDDLESGRWSGYRDSASDAASSHATGAYLYQWIFLLGSIVLVTGLLVVGFTGNPSERTICLIMISIITFSIYIGGIAWIDSVASSFAAFR